MKKAFVLSALLLSSVFFQSAMATRLNLVYKSKLTKINADKQIGVDPQGGHIIYNPAKKSLNLFISFAGTRCAPGSMCPMYIQPPLQMELPIVEIKEDSCGGKVVIAETNNLSVDGFLNRLTVVDNSTNHCQYIRAIASVEGEFQQTYYDRFNGEQVTSSAAFEGESFVSGTKVLE